MDVELERIRREEKGTEMHFAHMKVENIFTLFVLRGWQMPKDSPEYCKVAACRASVYLAVELLMVIPSDISLKVS